MAVPVDRPTSTIPSGSNFDKELLRRFYLKNGYADFEVIDATAELSPDRKAFFLTFTVHEGERYRVGKVTINSQLRNVCRASRCASDLQFDEGDWYDGDAVGRSADAIEDGHPHPRLCLRRGQAADRPAIPRTTPSTWSSTWARGRGSISSASTSSATRAPRTR